MVSLPGMKKNCMAAKYILLVFKQTVKLKKDFTRVSRVALLFDFNLKYRSSYATFKLLAQFLFGSALKME